MDTNFDLDRGIANYSHLSPAERVRLREAAIRHAHDLRAQAYRDAFVALGRALARYVMNLGNSAASASTARRIFSGK